ncbi:hypothetical protein RIF29_10798 [Crotalaria pallida]|uniref:Uncharacterized protein n=1 Tax=Crotalaria pallida TaxID=3830 RepID=A0AAN9FZ82_CROPI
MLVSAMTRIDANTQSLCRLDMGRVLILTSSLTSINEVVEVRIEGEVYTIKNIEEAPVEHILNVPDSPFSNEKEDSEAFEVCFSLGSEERWLDIHLAAVFDEEDEPMDDMEDHGHNFELLNVCLNLGAVPNNLALELSSKEGGGIVGIIREVRRVTTNTNAKKKCGDQDGSKDLTIVV